jgi:hypothetical protein
MMNGCDLHTVQKPGSWCRGKCRGKFNVPAESARIDRARANPKLNVVSVPRVSSGRGAMYLNSQTRMGFSRPVDSILRDLRGIE